MNSNKFNLSKFRFCRLAKLTSIFISFIFLFTQLELKSFANPIVLPQPTPSQGATFTLYQSNRFADGLGLAQQRTPTYDFSKKMPQLKRPQRQAVKLIKPKATLLNYLPLCQTSFVYDPDGGRTQKLFVNTQNELSTTTYIGNLYEIEDASNEAKNTKHIFLGSNRICSIENANNQQPVTNFFHTDHLGSSNLITDQAGNLTEYLEYQPFGTTSKQEGEHKTNYKFTGKEFDNSTNLYFYSSRYYDPNICRFIQPDTIVPDPNDPQSLNRYSYCRNNPIKYTDPTGHSFWDFFGKIFGAIFGTIAGIATGNFMVAFQVFNMVDSLWTVGITGNWGGFGAGVAGGLLGGFIGGGIAGQVAGMLGETTFTFGGGFLIGATEMGTAGFGSGFFGALGSGASAGDSFKAGGIGAAIGAMTGGIMEGSYAAGWQHSMHGKSYDELGRDSGVNREMSLERVTRPLPKLIKAGVEMNGNTGGDAGYHWGLRIKDNYNQYSGTWDFDMVHNGVNEFNASILGIEVPGIAGTANKTWANSIPLTNDVKYITAIYGNIQENIGWHNYKLDSYNCQVWVNNRESLRTDNFVR